MKAFKRYIVAAACTVAASCVNLDYNGNVAYDGRVSVSDLYAQLYNGEFEPGSAHFLAGATDEAFYALPDGEVSNYWNGSWSAVNPHSCIWTDSYAAISKICRCLENPDDIRPEDIRETLPYELRFLRAYFYFELFRAYGDVPLVTKTLSGEQADTLKRTPYDRIVKFIVDEVDEIATHLPVSYALEPGGGVGRATRCAAYALKARTLLYAASPLFNPTEDKTKWEAAAEASKYILDHARDWGFKLGNYDSLWGDEAFSNKEIILGVELDPSNAFEMANYPVGIENGHSGNCPSQSLVDQYEFQDNGQTFGERYPENTMDLTINPYEGLDPRFFWTVVKNGDEWPSNGAQKKTMETFTGGFNGIPIYGATPSGYYLKKFVDGSCVTTADRQTTSHHTWIIYRLAEFYLDFAEAAYRATGSANDATFGMTANDAVNVLRNRPSIQMPEITEDGEAWVERYERERLVELAFENHRFWDVRRWKKGGKYFRSVQVVSIFDGGNTASRSEVIRIWDEKYNLFPVPASEIRKNPNLTQNPGW